MKIHKMSELCLQLGFCCEILYFYRIVSYNCIKDNQKPFKSIWFIKIKLIDGSCRCYFAINHKILAPYPSEKCQCDIAYGPTSHHQTFLIKSFTTIKCFNYGMSFFVCRNSIKGSLVLRKRPFQKGSADFNGLIESGEHIYRYNDE